MLTEQPIERVADARRRTPPAFMNSRRAFLTMPLVARAAEDRLRPNVVFILVDDLRWDELGCTGHPFAETPNVNRLAKEGADFRNAFASTPLCSPSRAAFLTGTYSHANGVTDNVARDALSHRLVTWPRLLLIPATARHFSVSGTWGTMTRRARASIGG